MIEEDFKRKQLQSEFEIPSSKRGVIKSAINFFRPTRNIDLARELTQNAISENLLNPIRSPLSSVALVGALTGNVQGKFKKLRKDIASKYE